MRILVFGSLNIDKTYLVDHLVLPGETIAAKEMNLYCGGKGFNQAIALRRAGNEVWFAGAVGFDGDMLINALRNNGIHSDYVKQLPCCSGHAVIQVDQAGQNSIMILAGSNAEIDSLYISKTLEDFDAGDLIVLQNEIANVEEIIKQARDKNMVIAFNPSPYNEQVAQCNLSLVDYLLINETEGEAISGTKTPDAILQKLHQKYPPVNILLTLGSKGAVFMTAKGDITRTSAYPVKAADTTAAGDTFTGYFLSELLRHGNASIALKKSAIAAGIAVTKKGAEPSIPLIEDVQKVYDAVL